LDLNRKRLAAYLSKVVLFPKNGKDLKKGVVNDTKDAASIKVDDSTSFNALPCI